MTLLREIFYHRNRNCEWPLNEAATKQVQPVCLLEWTFPSSQLKWSSILYSFPEQECNITIPIKILLWNGMLSLITDLSKSHSFLQYINVFNEKGTMKWTNFCLATWHMKILDNLQYTVGVLAKCPLLLTSLFFYTISFRFQAF